MRVCTVFAAAVLVAGCTTSTPTSAQPAASNTGPSPVVAVVDGTSITEADLRQAGGPELARAEQEFHSLKTQVLDSLIAQRLLEAEAKKRGVSVDAFVQSEIASKVTPVTEAEVDAFAEANRGRVRGDIDQLRPQIRQFLAQQKLETQRDAVVSELRARSSVDVRMAAPVPFRAEVDLTGAPVRGDESAPVTIVEFSDFHCPFCRRVQPTLLSLLDRYKGKVRLVYKHLPLDGLHPQARRVSEASWCAGRQGKFWQFHDAVYADASNDSSDATLARFATAAGLDTAAFTSCLASPEAAEAVRRDVAQGEALGLSATPGFLVNGRELRGAMPIEAFAALIDEELAGK